LDFFSTRSNFSSFSVTTVVDADEISADNIDFAYWNELEQTYDSEFKVGNKRILLREIKEDPEIIEQAVAEASDSDFEVVD